QERGGRAANLLDVEQVARKQHRGSDEQVLDPLPRPHGLDQRAERAARGRQRARINGPALLWLQSTAHQVQKPSSGSLYASVPLPAPASCEAPGSGVAAAAAGRAAAALPNRTTSR